MIWQDTNPATCARCSVRLSSYDPTLPPVCGRCAEIHAPYRIKPKDKNAGGPFKVVNDLGEVKGTHDTWDEARQQQEALYVNVPGASEMAEEKHKKKKDSHQAGLDDAWYVVVYSSPRHHESPSLSLPSANSDIIGPYSSRAEAESAAYNDENFASRGFMLLTEGMMLSRGLIQGPHDALYQSLQKLKMGRTAYDMESDPERYNICDCGHSKAQHEDGTGACTMPNCTDGGCDEYIEEFFEDEEPPTGSKWIPGIPSTSGRTASEGTWSVGSNPNHSRYTAPDTSTVATVAMGSSVGGMPEAKDDDWVWWVEGYGDDGEDGEWDTLAEGIANSEEAAKTAALAVFEKYSY